MTIDTVSEFVTETPLMRTVNDTFLHMETAELAVWIVDELVRVGAASRNGDWVLNQ